MEKIPSDLPTLNEVMDSSNLQNGQKIDKKQEQIELFKKYGEIIIKKYNKANIIETNYKILMRDGDLFIDLKYFYSTDLNPFKENIHFIINVSENFPIASPSVKCRTNFCFPTLYDGRELLEAVISHNWSPNKENPLKSIEEIILQIPSFLKKNHENIVNRTLFYYGRYDLQSMYNLNNFIENDTNTFIRGWLYNDKGKKVERYIIITDLYFLMFEPVETQKNLGFLDYYNDIRNITECSAGKMHNSLKKESVIVFFPKEAFEIVITNKENSDFKNLLIKKKNNLTSRFQIFHNEESFAEQGNTDLSDFSNIKNLIQYKEIIYNQQGKKSLNLIKSLISLYEKAVELLSAKGDESYTIYLEKLKTMYVEESKMDNQEEDAETLFQNSKIQH